MRTRKLHLLSLAYFSLVVACKPSSIFTEIDASFKALEDVYIAEFRNELRRVEKNEELTLDAVTALTGHYGTTLTLDVWEFKSETECKSAYETLVSLEKQNQPREYSQTRAAENRYQFIRQIGIAGEIFTIKKILFRILGTDKTAIAEYLIASKLARAR